MPILSIPPGLSAEQFLQALNDRFRKIDELFGSTGNTSGPVTDMAGARIQRLGDAVNGTDALNLRTADKRYVKSGTVRPPTSTAPVAPSNVRTVAATVTLVEQTLTASSTAIASPITPVQGELLAVKLRQDATGGRAITWGADFYSLTSVDLSSLPNQETAFMFVAFSDLLWHPIGNPFREV